MGELDSAYCGISASSVASVALVTDADFFNFGTPYSHGSTQMIGGDLALDYCAPQSSSKTKLPREKVQQVAVRYMRGYNTQVFTEEGLPSPLNAFPIMYTRDAKSHLGFVEYRRRWSQYSAFYQKGRVTLFDTWFGLGAGGMLIRTKITDNDGTESTAKGLALFATGAIQGDLIRLSWGKGQQWSVAVKAAVRLSVGNVIIVGGEAGISLSRRWAGSR